MGRWVGANKRRIYSPQFARTGRTEDGAIHLRARYFFDGGLSIQVRQRVGK